MSPDQTKSKSGKRREIKMGAYPGRRSWTVRIQWIDQLINQSIHGKVESRESEREGREEIEEEKEKRLEQVT